MSENRRKQPDVIVIEDEEQPAEKPKESAYIITFEGLLWLLEQKRAGEPLPDLWHVKAERYIKLKERHAEENAKELLKLQNDIRQAKTIIRELLK